MDYIYTHFNGLGIIIYFYLNSYLVQIPFPIPYEQNQQTEKYASQLASSDFVPSDKHEFFASQ